jgi:hypothetical protein
MDDRVEILDQFMRPTPEYPHGSWLYKVGGEVQVATGYYAELYPGKPSPYWHEGPPYFVVDTRDWQWEDKCELKTGK